MFADSIVHLFAPGFLVDPPKFELCVLLTKIMFPLITFVSLIALINGALNSAKVFGAAAWAQIWMNLVLILGAVLADRFIDQTAAIVLAVSVIIGGVVQIVTQIPALRRAGFSLAPSSALRTPVTQKVLKLLIPATLGAAIYQISIFINTLLASLLEEGSVAWLFYADRLTQLPIGVFTVSLASVILPTLAAAEAAGNRDSFSRSLVNSLRYTSFVIIPLSVGTFILAEPLIRLMFERGAFTSASSIRTAQAVQMFAIGLWGASCHSMIVRAFIARKDTRTPVFVSIAGLIAGVFLSLTFMGPPLTATASPSARMIIQFQDSLRALGIEFALGHAGLGFASSIVSTLTFIALLLILNRRKLSIQWLPFVVTTLKAVLAAGAMGAILIVSGITELTSPLAIGLGTPLGVVSFLVAAFILRMREIKQALDLIISVGKRRRSH